MSIFWLMFWKAIVVAVWLVIVERWAAFRKRRRQEGLPLKHNKRTGVYEVRDWTAKIDRSAIWIRNAAYGFVFLWWTVLGGAYLFGGKEAARVIVIWLFFS